MNRDAGRLYPSIRVLIGAFIIVVTRLIRLCMTESRHT